MSSPAGSKTGAARRSLDEAIVFAPLVAATFLAKFCLPPLGERGIGILCPIMAAAWSLGVATGRLKFDTRPLLLFFLTLTTLCGLQLAHSAVFSPSSFLFFIVVGLSYSVSGDRVTSRSAMKMFSDVATLIALLGIVQFALQFVHVDGFPIEHLVPERFRLQRYNNIAPLQWGSDIFKSNGLVMIEPSVFSQMCALGIVLELVGRGRISRLAILIAALLVSYSGTGLVVLGVALSVYIVQFKRWKLVLYLALLLALLLPFAEPLHLDRTLMRTHEIEASGSSGYARFVAWRQMFADHLWVDFDTALTGNGAGTFGALAFESGAAEMSFSKIIFEFGLLGGGIYFAFILYCFLANSAPLVFRVAVCVTFLMNGAYDPWVPALATSLLIWPGRSGASARAAPERSRPLPRHDAGPRLEVIERLGDTPC